MATKTNTQDTLQKGSQWLRVSILTITTLGPIVGTLLERVRRRANQGSQPAAQVQTAVKGKVQEAQQRLEELTLVSRQQAAAQAQQLRKQAQQLQQQAEQLRKALREEARQRAKLAKQMRKAGRAWGQDVLKRGEQITEDIKERADSLTQEITKRTGKVAQDLSERGSQVTQEITKRTGKVAQDLSERGSELVQKRGRVLSIVGFSAGVVAAGVVTFIIVRRFVRQTNEQDEQIELPSDNVANGAAPQTATRTQAQPAGEIVMLNADGSMVTITEPESKSE
jgi:uncharacterized phage infection (PIP) family protein YhgE